MVQLLWTLFLAFLLLLTFTTIIGHIDYMINRVNIVVDDLKNGTDRRIRFLIMAILSCIGWAYWYMYFLN